MHMDRYACVCVEGTHARSRTCLEGVEFLVAVVGTTGEKELPASPIPQGQRG